MPSSNFDVAGPDTELLLIGNVAIRSNERFTYRVKEMEAINCPKANALIKREPRKGWEFGYA